MPFPKDKALISARIHERTVKLIDGNEYQCYFKEVPDPVFQRWAIAMNGDDEERKCASRCFLVSVSLCEEDGKPVFTYAEAKAGLHPVAAGELAKVAVSIVTGDGQKNAFPPGEKSGSGTS